MIRNESVKRLTPQILLKKANDVKLSKQPLDTIDQALLESIRKEAKNNMEIPDADVTILQSLPAKNPTSKNRNTGGLSEI